MRCTNRPALIFSFVAFIAVLLVPMAATAQVTKPSVDGAANFARLDTTVACAGVTAPKAVPQIKQMGYKAIIDLQAANEPGAEVEAEAAAARDAGIAFVHIPFNIQSPDPELVPKFLKAIGAPENNPAYIQCASGARAAAMWLIKRVQVDRWEMTRALDEAEALGLSFRTKSYALNYLLHQSGK